MEFIFELIMELILEGTVGVCTSKSKKVPIILRLLAGFILGVLYGGIFIGLFYAGITNNELIVVGISFFFLVATIVFLVKSYRSVKKNNNDTGISQGKF